MRKFATVFHWYCHTYPLQFLRKPIFFFVRIISSLYPRSKCAWKHRRNYLSTCHQVQYRLTLCIVTITTNYRRNNNEEMWQLWRNFIAIGTESYVKPITYDAHVVYATNIHGKFLQTCVDIATMTLGFKKQIYIKYGIPYCMPYYNVNW